LQYALVNSERCEAFPGGQGQCPICSSPTTAKCGSRVIHHWAHTSRKDCDLWWENETEWHRAWKNLFPERCREISYTAPDGEIHRADVVTQTGIVIEFQHSAMTDSERLARETFYQNLIWIVDGRGFRKNFYICHHLPHPQSEVARDIRWFKVTRPMHGAARGAFWRPSENPGHKTGDLVLYHSASEIEAEVSNAYRGHHQYSWTRPRRTWLDATCPVYLDLGDDLLAKLEIYDESGLPCIHLVAKQKLIHDAMTETAATAIATRFYPLPPNEPPRR
jgi:competence protein CoiA